MASLAFVSDAAAQIALLTMLASRIRRFRANWCSHRIDRGVVGAADRPLRNQAVVPARDGAVGATATLAFAFTPAWR